MESPSAIGMLADNSAAREYLSLLPRLWMPPLETFRVLTESDCPLGLAKVDTAAANTRPWESGTLDARIPVVLPMRADVR